MTTDETILKEMLDRATNPTKDTADELGIQMFCMVVRSDVQLIEKALDLLLGKIRTPNITEAIRAIALLEECMAKCGGDFQNEVAKFRFLNNLIIMVSSKHDGAKTPAAIKKRITDCLLLWTTDYPQKTKIREVYDMLSKQEGSSGDVVEQAAAAETKRESTLGIDEQLLAELLRSKDPENLKRANLLIQHRVNQDSRRNELHLQQKSELQEVENIVMVLNQMLDSYESEGGQTNEDTMSLIRELYLSCKKHKPLLQRLPELIDNSDQDLIAETIEANSVLQAVLKRYKQVVVHPPVTKSITANTKDSNSSNTDLLTQLLSDLPSDLGTSMTKSSNDSLSTTIASKYDPLDELSEIFGNDCASTANAQASKSDNVELLGSFDLLNDVNIVTAFPDTVEQTPVVDDPTLEKPGFRELREIDKLSEALFKQSLPTVERISSFKKEPEKLTLNDLAKEKLRTKPVTSKLNILKKSSDENNTINSESAKQHPLDEQDDVMLTSTDETSLSTPLTNIYNNDDICMLTKNVNASVESSLQPPIDLPLKNLADIEINLDDVVPTSVERMLLDDDDVQITLNFTKNRPSKNVTVLVITVLNKSAMTINDFQIEASVKRPSKVRLLPPTAVSMDPFKRFRPPAPINQVMLLLNPTGQAIDVTCIVGYKCGDDPDPIKESMLAKHIPYVE